MKTLLVTGSSGLIGSEVCVHFAERGWQVHGVDNNQQRCSLGRRGIRAGISGGCRSS
jgi:CDP-paratose 2-epimerase